MPNYPLTVNQKVTELNKAISVASKAVTQLGTADQNHPVDSNDGMEKEIQSENDTVKYDNLTFNYYYYIY
jgi:hypothetical protein